MGKSWCTVNGYLDDSKFSQPMPWIGIYVAAASLAITIGMALDAFRAFRYKKFWFPCNFFSLNATSLTLIGVAVKLSVDLNTPMPSRDDQLAKLSSTVLICCPQFVIGRSVTCTASGAICLLSAAILAQAMIISYFTSQSNKFCHGRSDYKWSISLILFAQAAAVAVGTIAPALRWFLAINYRCQKKIKRSRKDLLNVERYWIQMLLELKECPLLFKIKSPYSRKLAHRVKSLILDFCIGIQTTIVVVSKLVRYFSIFFIGHFLWFIRSFNNLRKRTLDGEEDLVHAMMMKNCDATDHSIRLGRKKQPKFLMQLLEKSTCSQGFTGVREFDSPHVPSLEKVEPPNCWAMPLVTLESKQDLQRVRTAADIVWQGVDLFQKWLDIDLDKMASQEKSPKEILEDLVTIGSTRFKELKTKDMKDCLLDEPTKWPPKVLAANSMYRLSKSILLGYTDNQFHMSEILFERLSIRIADILGACLTNLQHIISVECFRSNIEEREEGVRNAISLLGKAEKILKILDPKNLPCSAPCQMSSCIDAWHSLGKHYKLPMQASSPSSDCGTSSMSSDDVHISID